jgi:hypothetical protein
LPEAGAWGWLRGRNATPAQRPGAGPCQRSGLGHVPAGARLAGFTAGMRFSSGRPTPAPDGPWAPGSTLGPGGHPPGSLRPGGPLPGSLCAQMTPCSQRPLLPRAITSAPAAAPALTAPAPGASLAGRAALSAGWVLLGSAVDAVRGVAGDLIAPTWLSAAALAGLGEGVRRRFVVWVSLGIRGVFEKRFITGKSRTHKFRDEGRQVPRRGAIWLRRVFGRERNVVSANL